MKLHDAYDSNCLTQLDNHGATLLDFTEPRLTAVATSSECSSNKYQKDAGQITRPSKGKTRWKHKCWKTKRYLRRMFMCLVSHVGLAILVILYTLLGGVVFCYVERGKEIEIKHQMAWNRTQLLVKLMTLWRESQLEIIKQLALDPKELRKILRSVSRNNIDNAIVAESQNLNVILKDHANKEKLLEGLAWYLAGLGWPRRIVPPWWLSEKWNHSKFPPNRNIPTKSSNMSTTTDARTENYMSRVNSAKDKEEIPVHLLFSSELLNTIHNPVIVIRHLEDTLSVIVHTTHDFESKLAGLLDEHVKLVVKAIKDEGWNGAESVEDLNWTFEGSILFAVTIITTIGER